MANNRGSRVLYHCSFCGKNQDQVKRLIAGPGAVYICDECVELCREIIDEESSGAIRPKASSQRVPPPKDILAHLIQAADYDIQRAERGIVYIDEIDKIARKGDNPSITRDVSGEGVQQ